MDRNTRYLLGGLMTGLILLTGCGKKSATAPAVPAAPATDFDRVIQTAGAFGEVPERSQVLATESTSETVNGEVYYCTKTTYDVTKNFDTFPLFDPNSEIVFPGNLLQGATLGAATPSPVPVERGGGTIVVTLINGSNGVQRTIPRVALGNVVEAANQIVAANTGTLPARTTYSMERVSSREQLGLALNASYHNLGTEVQGSFNYRSDVSYTRYLVKLTQSYYTVAFELPTRTADFFAPGVTPADLARFVGPGNPAAFISSVTYGRVFYLLIQSTESAQSVEASIRASFEAAVSGGTIGAGVKYVSQLQSIQIGGYALGGESTLALAALQGGLTDLRNYITNGGTIRTGTPLSYVIRSVARPDQIVKVHVNTAYDVMDCLPVGQSLPNPIVWYGAQNGVSYTNTQYGPFVSRWDNLFDNAYGDAIPPVGGPGYGALYLAGNGPAGKPVLSFSSNSMVSGQMAFGAQGFENTDYTIFLVGLTLNYQSGQNWVPAYVLWGESAAPGACLQFGFSGQDSLFVSHGGRTLRARSIGDSQDYRLYTIRFSRTEGMSLYVNGVQVGNDPDFREPVSTFPGARIGTADRNRRPQPMIANKIAELRAFGTAADETQRTAIEREIRRQYSL